MSSAVLVIGRSENVLTETVELLLADGRSAGATNDFNNVMELFDATTVDTVVFGGMMPPDTKEALRAQLRAANPEVDLIRCSSVAGRRQRRLDLCRDQPGDTGEALATSLVPPEPSGTSKVIFNELLQPGSHVLLLPASIPDVASYIVVDAGTVVRPFTVGAMPRIELLPPV